MTYFYYIVIVAVIALVIALFLKYPKTSTLFLACFFSFFCLWFKLLYLPNRVLSAIPSDLNVSKILYRNEDYSGAGIVIYELPNETKEKIEKYGLQYLNTTYNKNNLPHNDDGIFKKWGETPISINEAWTGPVMDGIPEYKTNIPQISNYLSRYNLGLNLDQQIELQINRVIQNSGSYFAYQNVRLIIVSPSDKIIVYAYSR
jgi:hypothetical protein